MGTLTIGLMWQSVLVLILLRRQDGKIDWKSIKQRLWLCKPASPINKKPNAWLWLWIIPLIIVTALFEIGAAKIIQKAWTSIFPFFEEPAMFSLDGFLSSSEGKAQMIGAWGMLLLFIVNAVFNTFIGEELLFRGLLLPRMRGVFKNWDWVMNGVLFGAYHLHQPWSILSSMIVGIFLFSLTTRLFKSSWFGIILHSGQSVFFIFIMLGMVLGLA
jgi:membrane protease YdiL (CAAX protease family)